MVDEAQALADRIRNMTDVQLIVAKANRLPDDRQVLLVNQEIARRERLHQHELVKLIADQVRWNEVFSKSGVP